MEAEYSEPFLLVLQECAKKLFLLGCAEGPQSFFLLGSAEMDQRAKIALPARQCR